MKSIIGNTRRPDITFLKNGRIDISARIARLLDIHSGDVIDIAYSDKEFFLYIRHREPNILGRHEGRCFASKRGGNNLRVHSRRICEAILAECQAQNKAQLAVGEPADIENIGIAIPIITRHNLYETGN